MCCKGKRHGKAGQSRLLGILYIAPVAHLTKIRYVYVKIIYYTPFLDSMYNFIEDVEIEGRNVEIMPTLPPPQTIDQLNLADYIATSYCFD